MGYSIDKEDWSNYLVAPLLTFQIAQWKYLLFDSAQCKQILDNTLININSPKWLLAHSFIEKVHNFSRAFVYFAKWSQVTNYNLHKPEFYM